MRVITIILLILVSMSFTCVHPCNRGFTQRGGLHRHQNDCPVYKTTQALKLEHRRAHEKSRRIDVRDDKPVPVRSEIQATTIEPSNAMETDFNELSTPSPLPQPFPPPPLTQSGRPARNYRIPLRFRDVHPEAPPPLPLPQVEPIPIVRRVILHVYDSIRTAADTFGLLREYLYRPSYDPDASMVPGDLANYPLPPDSIAVPEIAPLPPWPFRNMSIYRMVQWMNTGGHQKSVGEVNRLVNDVICAEDFCPADLKGFSAQRENHHLDESEALLGNTDSETAMPFLKDGWQELQVDLEIPTGVKNSKAEKFTVHGLHRRSLVEVIKAAFSEAAAARFHLVPFKRFWQSGQATDHEERVHDEVYTSDAWLEAHTRLQRQLAEPGCKLEKVIAGLMFWSDSTHLTNFGTAKVWPLYLYFANLSKYFRARPNSGACHHVAYIPSLPDSIQDFITSFAKNSGTRKSALLTHCRRELMHQVWRLLFDDDFMSAYKHGIVLRCSDGVLRRVYPRIFTYSADYPEKVLLATVRDRGLCPCPRCLTSKADLDKMGLVRDLRARVQKARSYLWNQVTLARNFIYRLGLPVAGAAVERVLKSKSLVPTINAFAEKLGPLGFDFFPMLVVDLLHEFELGVWKATFTHLIRLLYAAVPAGRAVAELDARFRQVPSFGRDTIRRFCTNASEMKKLAARNFEDLLQCAIPVFEGLLPEPHNERLMTLLFRLAQWHALAKLRMHTDSTLSLLESTTTILGRELRKFRDLTCTLFHTTELPRETAARLRSQTRKTSQARVPTTSQPISQKSQPLKRKGKSLNLFTYKLHSLGDYVQMIRLFGTTDSYTTQIGELAHRLVKRLYGRTNKNQAVKQIAKLERRQTRLRRAREAAKVQACRHPRLGHRHHVGVDEDDPLPHTNFEMHHHMSDSRNHPHDIMSFVHRLPGDPAVKDFIPKLKDHLLSRLLDHEYDGDEDEFTDAERLNVRILNNRIYSSKVLRVNYTTYDCRRDQDSMNPRTNCDVMVLSREVGSNAQPYWYARVLGVFYADVIHVGAAARSLGKQRMEFLWVRWFGAEPGHRSGFKVARLPKIGFLSETDPSALGFLDPSHVIRGCHLIPAFVNGRTSNLLKTILPTAARRPEAIDDWANYYVNVFADRDMVMRYLGGGVGHVNTTSPSCEECDDEMDVDETEDQQPDDGQLLVEEANIDDEEAERLEAEGASDDDSEDSDDDNGTWDSNSDSESGRSESSDDGGRSDHELGPEDEEANSDFGDGYGSL